LTDSATREHWPAIVTEPLAIICIHLAGMDSVDSPAAIVYHHLLPWLRGNLVYFELDFDFRVPQSIHNFQDRLEEMVDAFTSDSMKP
jgi:hypothetical protein